MGFEPTTLRDLVGCSNHLATGDSMASKGEMWVCGSFFSEFPFDVKKPYHVVISKTRLDGLMVASLICLNVTARCSYESYVPYWFDYVTA